MLLRPGPHTIQTPLCTLRSADKSSLQLTSLGCQMLLMHLLKPVSDAFRQACLTISSSRHTIIHPMSTSPQTVLVQTHLTLQPQSCGIHIAAAVISSSCLPVLESCFRLLPRFQVPPVLHSQMQGQMQGQVCRAMGKQETARAQIRSKRPAHFD